MAAANGFISDIWSMLSIVMVLPLREVTLPEGRVKGASSTQAKSTENIASSTTSPRCTGLSSFHIIVWQTA
jgi:hypothetical protein